MDVDEKVEKNTEIINKMLYEMVKNQGYGEDYQITALFHDLLEDTDTTEEEILRIADQSVLTAVKLLTKENGCDMESYINGIKANPIAFVVKCADRLHNLQCALETSTEFKKKYILETIEWYLDFSKDIEQAVNKLKESIDVSIVQ